MSVRVSTRPQRCFSPGRSTFTATGLAKPRRGSASSCCILRGSWVGALQVKFCRHHSSVHRGGTTRHSSSVHTPVHPSCTPSMLRVRRAAASQHARCPDWDVHTATEKQGEGRDQIFKLPEDADLADEGGGGIPRRQLHDFHHCQCLRVALPPEPNLLSVSGVHLNQHHVWNRGQGKEGGGQTEGPRNEEQQLATPVSRWQLSTGSSVADTSAASCCRCHRCVLSCHHSVNLSGGWHMHTSWQHNDPTWREGVESSVQQRLCVGCAAGARNHDLQRMPCFIQLVRPRHSTRTGMHDCRLATRTFRAGSKKPPGHCCPPASSHTHGLQKRAQQHRPLGCNLAPPAGAYSPACAMPLFTSTTSHSPARQPCSTTPPRPPGEGGPG